MALRPGAEEIIRGVQRSLSVHVLPEVSSPYAQAQVNYALFLLNALAAEWDGAAQRLVEDNAAVRDWLGAAAARIAARDAAVAEELRAAAVEQESDLRISTLARANDRLRFLQGKAFTALGVADDGSADSLVQRGMALLREGIGRRTAGAL